MIKNSFDRNDEKALALSKESMSLSDEIEKLTNDLSEHKYEEAFSELSSKIIDITDIIKGISEQTNMLAISIQ